jgi:uncharacterized protein
MLIRMDDIREEGQSLTLDEAVEKFPQLAEMSGAGECVFTTPLHVSLRAMRVGEMVEVEGTVAAVVRLACSRCLQEFETPLDARFALTFAREVPRVTEEEGDEEVELEAEDLGLVLFTGDEIDLSDSIQEQVIMALPMRPLCREECRGLCPQCGADLNQVSCGCERPVSLGKFAALKDFKVDR